MSYFIVPMVLMFAVGAGASPADSRLADFRRFSAALEQEVAIVQTDGTVREGIVTAATEDDVSVRFGSKTTTFSRDGVASAERIRDGRKDGAVKGAIFGAIVGLAMLGSDYRGDRITGYLGTVAIYGGIGYLLDAAQTNREPIYRAPASAAPAPTASLKLSLRF